MTFKFSENKTIDALDKVPAQFRGVYQETDDGKFAINEGFAELTNSFDGLRGALDSERKKKTMDLSPLAEYGDTPEAIAEAVQGRFSEIEAAMDSKSKEKLDKMRSDMAEQHEKKHGTELAHAQARSQALESQLQSVLVDSKAMSHISEHRGVPELLMPFIRDRVSVDVENNNGDYQFKVKVIDPKDKIERLNHAGQPMSIGELVAEMKDDKQYMRLFDSEAPAGGGTPPAAGGASRTPARQAGNQANMSARDKITAGLSTGSKSFGAGERNK